MINQKNTEISLRNLETRLRQLSKQMNRKWILKKGGCGMTTTKKIIPPRSFIKLVGPDYDGKPPITGSSIVTRGVNTCQLYLDISSGGLGGICKVHNFLEIMLHNAHLPVNHVKFGINIAIDDDALLSISVEFKITIRGAIGLKRKMSMNWQKSAEPRSKHALIGSRYLRLA
ncbi:hypothetical protein Lal_00018534 [Lupinus albus]|nr:hypothetical protein Lal_00018534 [Lupinus albus]